MVKDFADVKAEVAPEWKWAVPGSQLQYRLATSSDLMQVVSRFAAMLRELAPLGHNILPTPRNLVTFTDSVFSPALETEEHGIAVALDGEEVIGCTFFTPDRSGIDTPGRLAVAYGAWVEPEWRSNGIMKQLQALAHARLSDLGYTHLVSVVVKDNVAGFKSAAAAGAEVVGYYTSVNLGEET